MEADLSRLRKSIDDGDITSDQKSRTMAKVAQSIATLQPLQKAQFEESTIYDTLLRASVSQLADLPILSFPLERSVSSLERLAADMDQMLRSRISDRTKEFRSLIDGPNSILRAREHEHEIMNNARLLLDGNVDFSRQLTDVVDRLVAGTNEDIDIANRNAISVQQWSTGVLLAVVGLSLISSILIVWLYVGRNLIARLTALSDSMLAIADGNLEATIPGGGDDEIGGMAKALVVFRDTAVEVRESNLREINEARRRLIDAIESIFEGFSLYDAEDRLVVCNSRYRKLLYPWIEDVVTPGTSFESIIRAAAERGLIRDAEGRIEEWVAERLALHRNPGQPHLQRRSEDQWILISERKTEDGGTVAVYADITELKHREQELSEKSEALEQKSKALEQLSNQLAKYLSPQLYDSIFSGKQEVKVASSRKKLTVFFSDIAGFTETADRMESEELTQLINHYLTEMSQIALDYGATIDKYIGDAMLIFFGDPESKGVKEDALACVNMAIAMQKRLHDLTDLWRDSGIEKPLRVRMGIHTGYCTVGNFGSEDRMDLMFFGDPETRGVKEDALACVQMALTMQKRMSELAEIWRDIGIETPLRCRIGIHTDYCTVGNFGSEDRMDYTIIGGAVNLAARLEQEAPPGTVLISYETFAQVKDTIDCEELGPVHVKGIAYPVATYRVIDLKANLVATRRAVRTELPHLRLEAEPELMSADERDQAATALRDVLDQLCHKPQ